jgi:hypothetical protein
MSTVHICLKDIFDVAVTCHVIFYPEDTPFFSGSALAVSGAHSILIDADGTGSVTLLPGRYKVRFAKITGNTDTLTILVPNEEGVYQLQELVWAGDWILPFRDFLQKSKNLADLPDPASAFAAIKQAATETATGAVQLATQAEVDAGIDASKGVTPATLANLEKWTSLNPQLQRVTVANAPARLALIADQVNVGDLVEQLNTRAIYQVLDVSALGHEWAFVEVGVRPVVESEVTIRTGLLAEWLFAAGSELADSSGGGNTLSNTNAVSFADGVASFDGTNYLSAASVVGAGSTGLTLSAWIRRQPGSGDFWIFGADGPEQPVYALCNSYINLQPRVTDDNFTTWGPDFDSILGELRDGNWHHIALVYGVTISLWVDGVKLQTDVTSGICLNTTPGEGITTHIGSNGLGNYGLGAGDVRALRIYGRSLSDAEIIQLNGEFA